MAERVPPAAGALGGLRVVELGHGISGPFAARLLGDLGATVVKVERPGSGDFARRMAPTVTAPDGSPVSALFEYLNWNKLSITLDLSAPGPPATLRSLVAWADVLISSFRPGRLEAWGIGPDVLREWNPALVVALISNFGQDGPYRDWSASDLIFQSMGGVAQISGTAGREPLKPGLRQSVYFAGLNAAYACLAGYYAAAESGRGAVIDLSIFECVASQMVMNEPYYAFVGAVQGRHPGVADPLGGDPLPTADGYLSLQTNTFTPVARLAELLDDPRLADPGFSSSGGRARHADRLRAILGEHLRGSRSRDLFVELCSHGYLAGFVQGADELISCPQLHSRDVYHAGRLTRSGSEDRILFPARLFTLSATPTAVRLPAPAVGEHTEEVLALVASHRRGREVSATPAAPDRAPGGPAGPLAGLRVLDLSTVFAVPYIGGLLADLGAEVIKIESPRRLDQTRAGYGACFDNEPGSEYWDRTTTFQVLNRGKRSIALDLTTEDGRDVFRELVRQADIVLDNFTPRVMRGWGTTYDELRLLNPRLIMLSNTGYGSSGPWSAFKAQGTSLEATMGMPCYTGYKNGQPAKAGQSYPDFLACWAGLLALLACLVHRQATGSGQWIDVGMYQLGVAVLPEALLHYQATGQQIPRLGNEDLDRPLSGLFQAHGDDRWLAVSLSGAEQLTALSEVVPGVAGAASGGELPDAEAWRLAGHAVGQWARQKDAAEAAAELQKAGIAAGPVNDARDLLTDEHLAARGFYEWVDYGPELGARPLIGRPYRWHSADGMQPRIRWAAPRYARDNDAVLGRLPGVSGERLRELREKGVLVDRPVNPPPAKPVDLGGLLELGTLSGVDEDYVNVMRQARPGP